jgi:hypothetical protein
VSVSLQALVISLSQSRRANQLVHAANANDWSADVVDAFDGRHLSDSELALIADTRAGRLLYGQPLSGSQVGCSLSHLRAYSKFLETDSAWALVLEDDAYPLEGLWSFASTVSEWNPPGPTIVQAFSSGRLAPKRGIVDLGNQASIQPLHTFPGFAVAYLINRGAASLALSSSTVVASRADWPQWAADVQFWRAIPNLVLHGTPGSPEPSTMVSGFAHEGVMDKAIRWLGLVTGVTYLRLRGHYSSPGQFARHAIKPSVSYWLLRVLPKGRHS